MTLMLCSKEDREVGRARDSHSIIPLQKTNYWVTTDTYACNSYMCVTINAYVQWDQQCL